MDLNGDGIDDIIAGSYMGDISIFKGLKGGGFAPSELVSTVFDVKAPENVNKFLFTNPTWGDIDGDGLFDAIIGCKYYKNIGTKTSPKLDNYSYLKTVDDKVVSHYFNNRNYWSVDFKSFNILFDWDNDGVKDLISTHSYYYENQDPILFHKGVKTDNGIRFEKGVGLIKQLEGEKSLPGKTYVPYIGDYNGDGKTDLILGITMSYNSKENIFDTEGEYHFTLNKLYYAKEKEIALLTKELQKKYKGKKNDEYFVVLQEETDKIEEKYDKLNPKPISYTTPGYKTRGYLLLFEGK